MKNTSQNGFSLLELLVVIVIIGIVATIGTPYFQRAVEAAENGNSFSLMRSISTAQMTYYSQHRRYARLPELNSDQKGVFGTTNGPRIQHGKFRLEMTPLNPTDDELKNTYEISATRTYGDIPYLITVNQSGKVTQVLP